MRYREEKTRRQPQGGARLGSVQEQSRVSHLSSDPDTRPGSWSIGQTLEADRPQGGCSPRAGMKMAPKPLTSGRVCVGSLNIQVRGWMWLRSHRRATIGREGIHDLKKESWK